MPALRLVMIQGMATTTEPGARSPGTPGLYRLLAWLSPGFPTGAFSYSHGLEAAVADGSVHNRASLEAWVAAIVTHGSGRIDADILCQARRAGAAGDNKALAAANSDGVAFRGTAELALESAQQGEAFLTTCRLAWLDIGPSIDAPNLHPNPPPLAEGDDGSGSADPPVQVGEGGARADRRGRVGGAGGEGPCHSAAFGAAAASAGISLEDALVGYLQAFAGNLISAGLRLGVIGQTDGQRILAALEPIIAGAAAAAQSRDPADFGSATLAVDLASMAHETQYTRLFRS
jgi:urease accessory protein